MDEKNNFVMVRCEFEGHGKVRVYGDFNCEKFQLLVFAAEVVKSAAKELSLDPLEVAMLAIQTGKFSRCVGDESEKREES